MCTCSELHFCYLYLISGSIFFFSECRVFLFDKISFGQTFLNGYGTSYNLSFHIHNVFNWSFYLRYTVISKEHLQPYVWVVPSLFQEAVCNDLVFSRVLCFFEKSTCSHFFFQRYWVNSQFQLQPSVWWMALFL